MLKKLLHIILIVFSVWTLLSILFLAGFFASWQNKLSDTLFTSKKASDKIVIIAIDDKSIQSIGRWPWTRTVHADLLKIIETAKPQSIGIDISFLEQENPLADAALEDAINKFQDVVLASEVVDNKILSPIYSSKTGVVNTVASSDGVTRHALFTFQNTPHFASQISGVTNPYLEKNLLRINFVGPPNSFPIYSYVDVLKGIIPPVTFKDKIILIGATAPDLHDEQIVPTSGGTPMPGVEIQANIIQTLINKDYLVVENKYLTLLMMGALSLFVGIALSFLGIFTGIFLIFITLAAYIIFAIFSFDGGTIRNLIFPPLVILTTGVADIIYKYFSEYRQKRYIKKALSFYLSKPVMNQILSNPKNLILGGERKEITVLFSDIAGFTTISEKLKPEVLSRLLNQYLTAMTNIVFKYDGVLDKYIGDAVMAFWGAPIKTEDHATKACLAAVEMQEEIQRLAKDWQKEGIEDFHVRIGINTGEMIVGNMGSDVRFDYTLIGDNVNLGSRLESINKVYGTKIIISQNTFEIINNKFTTRKLDNVEVKGKTRGILIYEIGNFEKNYLDEFEKARFSYEKGEFEKALDLFKTFAQKYPEDNPTKLYLARCHELSNKSASWRNKEWDGIFKATEK